MQDILNQAKQFIDTISQRKLDSLCSTSITKREKAIHGILNGLDANDENSGAIFQAIPIELASRQEEIAALYFAETNIKNGNIFEWEILESIITTAIIARKEISIEGDMETVGIITRAIHTLFRTLLEVDIYSVNPNVYLLMGSDSEYIGKPSEAISIYLKAMELGSIESYLRIAAIYDYQNNYAMGIATLEEGYKLLGEISFLHGLIRMYHKNGDQDTARARYIELSKKTKEAINPFLLYTGNIDNDNDLIIFEKLMASYFSEGIGEPSSMLTELAVSASIYISNQIELVNIDINRFTGISDNEWGNIHTAVYMCLITRRLYLMQNHIITLRDSRYLEQYLDDIDIFAINGNDKSREIIGTFFDEYFSVLALSEYKRISEDQNISVDNMNIFEMIRVHIVQIAAIFGQGPYHDILLDKMDPMVRKCLELEYEGEDIPDHFETENQLLPLKNENDFYSSLPIWMQRSYDEFMEYFDKKYGIYYRRTIQIFARDSDYDINTHKDIFENYSDVALLFWIEKILHGGLSDNEEESDINKIIEGYHLNQLLPAETLLFAAFLSEGESQFECAIEILINTPGILDFPNTLILITNILLHLNSKEELDHTLSALDELSQEQYGARDFFDHIDHIFLDTTIDPDTSVEDIGCMLFTLAYRYLLQENIEQAIIYFQEAAEHDPMRGYREIGDIYQEQGEYDKAIIAYGYCYLANPIFSGIGRMISCCIASGKFEKAKEYIESAIQGNHDISSDIFAYHLWQGNEKEAMDKLVEIIQSNGQIEFSCPSGTLELLTNTVNCILKNKESSIELDTLKILASYIDMNFLSEKDTMNPLKFIEHFSYIVSLLDQYSGDELYECIEEVIGKFVDEPSEFNEKNDRMEGLLGLLHTHGVNIYHQMGELHTYYENTKNIEGAKATSNAINMFINNMILIFQRFPESEKYIIGWAKGIAPGKMEYDIAMIHGTPDLVQ